MKLKIKGVASTVFLLVLLALFFAGVFVAQHLHFKKRINAADFHGTYLEHPKTINQFSLVGIDQRSFNNDSLKGQWTLMFFGFTQCSSICPTIMAELAKMQRILEAEGVHPLPRVVLVSIDPDRDEYNKIEQYVHSFHPSFYGARGESHAIRLMTQEMGIAYKKVINKKGTRLEFDLQHSGALIVFNPQGELNAFFTTPHHADLLAKDYKLLVS